MSQRPPTRRSRFRWGIFAVAAVGAGLLHAFVIIPQLLLPLLERKEAPIEIAMLDEPAPPLADEQTPAEPEATSEKKPEPKIARKPPEKPKAEPPKPELPKAPEPAKVEPPKPEPKPVEVVKLPPPPPPPPVNPRMKMVDQDRPDDEPDNPDAHYLAQKNHRATVETRAENSNLVRNQKGDTAHPPSEPSPNQDPNPGMKDRKIAELEQRKGEPNKLV